MRDIESEYMRESRGKQRVHRQPVSVWARQIDSHRGECEGPFYRPQGSRPPPPLADSNHTKSRQSLLAPGHCVLSYFLILSLSPLWYSITVILTRARGRVVVSLNRSLQMSLVIWRGRQQHNRLSERPTAAPVDLKIYQEWWALFHIMTSMKNISALY